MNGIATIKSSKLTMLNHVVGVATSAFVVGLFFVQALHEGLRGRPSVYVYVLGIVVFSFTTFVYSRRILRENAPAS
jgi:hypothetical protein